MNNMKPSLEAIQRKEYYKELSRSKDDWKKLMPYTAQVRAGKKVFKMSIKDFRSNIWEAGVGEGGIFAEYLNHPFTVLPYITSGEDRQI